MSTSKRPSRIAFRSKPVSRRTTQTKQPDAESWTPTGPFRFLQLPFELRIDILKAAIRHDPKHHQTINLLLVCQQIFHEAASLSYKNTTVDLTHAPTSARKFEQVFSSITDSKLSLWRHVQSLSIRLYLVDHLHLLPGCFGTSLQEMTQSWNLRRLRIQIESKFPSDDFFGTAVPNDSDSVGNDDDNDATDSHFTRNGVSDLWKYHHLLTGSTKRSRGNEPEIYAPVFVSTPPFQNFLRFLYLCKVPDLSLHVDAHDHHSFWCIAHKDLPKVKDASSNLCVAVSGSKSHVEIDSKELIRTYGGARLP